MSEPSARIGINKGGWQPIAKDILFLGGFYFVVTSLFFGFFHIPSSSMEPTLEVGDRLVVSKPAYGYNKHSFPFDIGWQEKVWPDGPERGDVAVFSAHGETDTIKRVIGLPGDRIAMIGGRLIINGKMVERRYIRDVRYTDYRGHPRKVREFEETLPGGTKHHIYERSDRGPLDDTPEIVVQSGHYFLMGDNRDNSIDSRDTLGQVPIEHFLGKALVTTFSLYDCDQGKPVDCAGPIPTGRFFRGID